MVSVSVDNEAGFVHFFCQQLIVSTEQGQYQSNIYDMSEFHHVVQFEIAAHLMTSIKFLHEIVGCSTYSYMYHKNPGVICF